MDKTVKNKALKERADYLKKIHKCPICMTKDERTMAGRVYCESCAARYRGYYHKRKAATA